jgi:hypothetical protein
MTVNAAQRPAASGTGRRSRQSGAGALLLATLVAAGAAHAADEEEAANVTAKATIEWLTSPYERVQVGMRTSDVRSRARSCSNGSSTGSCTVTDTHSSTPKNIGNILCMPTNITKVEIDPACSALLVDGKFDHCQRNAFNNNGPKLCNTSSDDRVPLMPACNYRTEKTGEVEWKWTIAQEGDVYVVGCSQRGYRGYTPDPGDQERSESIATGCLHHGRLTGLALGDQPLRPCRPDEAELALPLEAAD